MTVLDPSKTLNNPCRLLTLFGVFNHDRVLKGFRLGMFISILYIPVSSCYSWSFLRYYGKYEDIVNIMYVLAVIQGTVKMFELKANHKEMMELIQKLNADNFDIFPEKHTVIIEKSLSRANKIFLFFFILLETSMLFVVFSWFVRKLFYDSSQRILMLDSWMPYNYGKSPVYEFTVAFQMISVAFTTNSLLACDTLIFGLIHLMTTQIDILNEELSSLGRKSQSCKQLLRNIELCVTYNENIAQNFQKFNSLVQMGLVAQLALTEFLVCMSLFAMHKNEANNFDFIKNWFLIACVVFQLFYYCYFGQTVITKSNDLSKSVYSSKWYEYHCRCPKVTPAERCSHERLVRKSFLIIMCCVQKPILLTAGKLLILKYETYVQILKAGYSYYTVFGG